MKIWLDKRVYFETCKACIYTPGGQPCLSGGVCQMLRQKSCFLQSLQCSAHRWSNKTARIACACAEEKKSALCMPVCMWAGSELSKLLCCIVCVNKELTSVTTNELAVGGTVQSPSKFPPSSIYSVLGYRESFSFQ